MKLFKTLTLMLALLAMVGAAVFAQENPGLDRNLPSRFGSVELVAGFAPNPYIITLTGGVEPGNPGVEVSTLNLGEACLGFSTPAPTYRLTYTAGETQTLRFFFTGVGDAVLIIRAPDGTIVCNDDTEILDAYNPLNPSIDFAAPLSGEYGIRVASYDGSPVPGYLFITEGNANSPTRLISDVIPAVDLPIAE